MTTGWPPCLCTIATRAVLVNESAYIDQELEKKYTHAQTQGWFSTPDKWIILPSNFATHLVRHVHQSIHLGDRKIQDLLRRTHLKVFHLKAQNSRSCRPMPHMPSSPCKKWSHKIGHWSFLVGKSSATDCGCTQRSKNGTTLRLPRQKTREWIKKADQVSGLRERVKKDLSGSLRNRQWPYRADQEQLPKIQQ